MPKSNYDQYTVEKSVYKKKILYVKSISARCYAEYEHTVEIAVNRFVDGNT